MALFSQAALLDELFGTDRNSTVKQEISWDDESICKYYLAGFCPHDLFVNTKMSLGLCPKVHDVKLLEKYKNSKQLFKVGYERRLQQFLQRYVDDVKKKIIYNVERLENGLLSGTEVGIQKRITALEKEVNELVTKIEDCGNEGRIEECRYLNNALEEKQKTLKYDRIELETQRRNTRERLEEVCNMCGAYISKNDPRNSLENHVSGRIHCSYVKINEVLGNLDETLRNAGRISEERQNSSEKDRKQERKRERSYERDSRSESKHRHREHDRRHDSRRRSRDDRRRSRSRDRNSERKHKKSHRRENEYSRSPTNSPTNKDDFDNRNAKNVRNECQSNDNNGKDWGEI